MKLSDYLNDVLPTMNPNLPKGTASGYRKGVKRFNEWLGREIELADVSPAMIDKFREIDSRCAGSVRALMATHDPVKFRQHARQPAKPRVKPASQAGIYLENVYSKKISRWRLGRVDPTPSGSTEPR